MIVCILILLQRFVFLKNIGSENTVILKSLHKDNSLTNLDNTISPPEKQFWKFTNMRFCFLGSKLNFLKFKTFRRKNND